MGKGLGRGEVLLRPLPKCAKKCGMTTLIYWFRNDLRLADNPAFSQACQSATLLLPVYCHDPKADETTPWGFARTGPHRRQFLVDSLADLSAQLASRGSGLLVLEGRPQDVLPALALRTGVNTLVCEVIAAPEEEAEVTALRSAGLAVTAVWQSSLLEPVNLPFAVDGLPSVFTVFRQALERAEVLPLAPQPFPANVPPLPTNCYKNSSKKQLLVLHKVDKKSSFPYQAAPYQGGEAAATAHVAQYFHRKLAHTYKATRNDLTGVDYSSKFSPWLATGALSARTAYAALKAFEAEHGANDGSYWLWFELLWRDYFRLLHLQYGRRLYRERGLADSHVLLPEVAHNADAFTRWCQGATDEPLVDAGMRELALTGYLSNRLRQIVASYLIHDLACDWRAGAAWFEAQLVDYDVYSNQGNWLYIAGRGTDPRGGRRFNPQKQAHDHDPQGHYRKLWHTL